MRYSIVVKSLDAESQTVWVQTPVLPPTICNTLGRLVNLSCLIFIISKMKSINKYLED